MFCKTQVRLWNVKTGECDVTLSGHRCFDVTYANNVPLVEFSQSSTTWRHSHIHDLPAELTIRLVTTGPRSQRCGSMPAACSWRAAHRAPTSLCGTSCLSRGSSGCVATTGRCVSAFFPRLLSMYTIMAARSLPSVESVTWRMSHHSSAQRVRGQATQTACSAGRSLDWPGSRVARSWHRAARTGM